MNVVLRDRDSVVWWDRVAERLQSTPVFLRYTWGVVFEWDDRKARANLRKHGVSFEEATGVFRDPMAMTIPDLDHSDEEEREITMGHARGGWLMFVTHCRRGNRVRIIGARRATQGERKRYEEEFGPSPN